ncbi:hypothetical protein N7455_004770 [Penicillium solitum]|uniref:uncharacterized protein n=1 Tax=Penicillium solitum TaxID=60172 RepID=UPI00184E82B3|nr:hypothetical protein HAV15_003113 [Penicillium sp. str. \
MSTPDPTTNVPIRALGFSALHPRLCSRLTSSTWIMTYHPAPFARRAPWGFGYGGKRLVGAVE